MRNVMVLCLVLPACVLARGPEPAKPVTPPVDPAVTKVEPFDPAQEKRNAMIAARYKADLMRADFEKRNRPGPLNKESGAAFDAIVAAYRDAIDLEPRGEHATYCRQRLAGAYTYTGDHEAGLRILIEAVNVAAGPVEQVKACLGAGNHCLQALHKPAEARKWFERAKAMLEKLPDDGAEKMDEQEKAKWRLAIAQGLARCD